MLHPLHDTGISHVNLYHQRWLFMEYNLLIRDMNTDGTNMDVH